LDLALNVAREADLIRAEIADLALPCGRPIARPWTRALVKQLAEELLAELELAALP
jgi:hypothetical protein